VAQDRGLISKNGDGTGTVEKKYGIKIVLKQADYDACITMFASGAVDADCQTNIDSLAPALGRNSVMIMPTSTSVGADALLAVGFDDGTSNVRFANDEERQAHINKAKLAYLKGKPTFGLEKSCSQYVFDENITLLGGNPDDYSFRNMDPAAAAQAMQTGQPNINSIMVWNPFVMQTLRTRKDAKPIFTSATIPEEVIDSIVVAKDVLAKPKGKEFAFAIMDTYYQVCKMMEDPKTGDDTFVALGARFSNLNAADMRIVCKETRFYDSPKAGLELMHSKKFQTDTMPKVVNFGLRRKMVDKKPTVGFNDSKAQLNFDDSYLTEFSKK
jgi:ABC-type nitrate/sulfonate/bicarbonate transport system substrate-binding protein